MADKPDATLAQKKSPEFVIFERKYNESLQWSLDQFKRHDETKHLAADLLQMVEELSEETIRNQTDGSMNWPHVIDRHRIECEGVAHLINRAKDMLGGNNADR